MHQTAQDFQNFLKGASICPELASICVQLYVQLYVVLHENSHFLFKIISK